MPKLTQSRVQEILLAHLQEGENLHYWAYGVQLPSIAVILVLPLYFRLTKHYVVGLSDRRVIVLRITGLSNHQVREFTQYGLDELPGMAVSVTKGAVFTRIRVDDLSKPFEAKFHRGFSTENRTHAIAIADAMVMGAAVQGTGLSEGSSLYCTSCGARLQTGSRFCIGCGLELDVAPETPTLPAVGHPGTEPAGSGVQADVSEGALEDVGMATVEQMWMKVQRMLTGPMGLTVEVDGDTMQVRLLAAPGTDDPVSTAANITVKDWGQTEDGDPQTLVHIWAAVLRDVEPSPALFEWVARKGGAHSFGHVRVFDDDAAEGKLVLVMEHSLLGDSLDQCELEAGLYGVYSVADMLDDQLQQKFGGKRWSDE